MMNISRIATITTEMKMNDFESGADETGNLQEEEGAKHGQVLGRPCIAKLAEVSRCCWLSAHLMERILESGL